MVPESISTRHQLRFCVGAFDSQTMDIKYRDFPLAWKMSDPGGLKGANQRVSSTEKASVVYHRQTFYMF